MAGGAGCAACFAASALASFACARCSRLLGAASATYAANVGTLVSIFPGRHVSRNTWRRFGCVCARSMGDASLPRLAQLFLDVVLLVLPRNSFDGDRAALLRLASVRKHFVEDMRANNGAFALDLHLCARNVVMVSPYPSCHLACFDRAHIQSVKRLAARFQSIGSLSIDLHRLPRDLFAHGLRHLFPFTKNQLVSLHLSHCKLAVNSHLLRELASLRNLTSLTLDGNKFHVCDPCFPGFSDKLECLSVAGCRGVRAVLLASVSKTLQSLVWNDNVMLESEKPFFFAWLADSRLDSLDVENCGLFPHDAEAFQAAFARMPSLMGLNIAHNEYFENIILWWMYEHWRGGHVPCFFRMHVSNMHVCFPDHGAPVFLSD